VLAVFGALLAGILPAGAASVVGPVASADAALFHSFDSYIGGGTISTPEALAVDQTTGDLYVLEHGTGCVSRFHGERGGPEALEPRNFPATGTNKLCGLDLREEPSAAQIAIDNSGTSTEGEIYVNSPLRNAGVGATLGFDNEGNLETELTPKVFEDSLFYVCGVSVDPAGNVYVAERYGGVHKFNHDDPVSDDDYEGGIPSEGPACAIAQNSFGSWYGSWPSNGPLIHSGLVLRETSLAIGLDPSLDDIYVSEGDAVSGISADDITFDRFGSGQVSEARGVAIDETTGIAYVADTPNGRVAIFQDSPAHRLDVELTGTGLGAVSAESPPLEACGDEGPCVGYYAPSTMVLEATAQPHSEIDGWTGCDDVNPAGDQCTVELSGDRQVVANFTRLQQTVTASTAGTGSGVVDDASALGAIQDCGDGGNCSGPYDEGSAIELVATPTGHSSFTGWSGDCTNQSGPCELVVEGQPSVTAHFTAQHAVSIKKVGTGAGAVVSEPNGLDCGGICVGHFTDGEMVTLTAVPSGHSTFVGWSGAGCSGTGACEVEAGEATKTVTASFAHDLPSAVTDPGASFVGQHVATVHGSVNPNGASVTKCVIEYGTSTAYGAQSPCAPSGVGSGEAPVPIGVNLADLLPGIVYHYRLSATTVGGTANGSDQTFRTLDDTCDTNEALCPAIRPFEEARPKRCKKGRVLRKGRCVKRKRHRHRKRGAGHPQRTRGGHA
jgi:Divergent InlB B-repeat domain